jgi:hypothetical protein
MWPGGFRAQVNFSYRILQAERNSNQGSLWLKGYLGQALMTGQDEARSLTALVAFHRVGWMVGWLRHMFIKLPLTLA